MASEDTNSGRQRGKNLLLTALVTAVLALGGATAATVADMAQHERLPSHLATDRTHTALLAISDEDDCSMAAFRCTRYG